MSLVCLKKTEGQWGWRVVTGRENIIRLVGKVGKGLEDIVEIWILL